MGNNRALDWANKRLSKPPSETTQAQYQRVATRLQERIADGILPGDNTVVASGRTRAVERAACRWWSANEIVRLAKDGDTRRITGLWVMLVDMEAAAETAKADYRKGEYKGKSQRRHSKRRSLRGLPSDWRQRLIKAAEGSKYADQIRVMALCGCRPAELVMGVIVERVADYIRITVQGAKVSGRTGGGQDWRILELDAAHELAESLRPGTYAVPSAKAIERAVEHFGRKVWPNRAEPISAYSLRHAVATDFKTSGLSIPEIAASLGHSSTATMQRYGSSNKRSTGAVALRSVEAANDVREPKKGARPRARKNLSRRSSFTPR